MKGFRPSVLACAVAIASLGCLIPRALAAQITPVGPEVRADTRSDLSPSCPHLAVGPDKSFEIAWDYGTFSINTPFGCHFSPGGEPSSDAQVQIGPSGGPFNFVVVDRVTPLADGFQAFLRLSHHTQPQDNLRQLLDPNGDPAGTAELLGIKLPILVGPGGDLYAAFFPDAAKRLWIQRVAPDGTPRGPRILLSTRPAASSALALAPFANGDFVVGWLGLSPGKNPRQALRARVVHQGVPVGQEIDLNAVAGGRAGRPPWLALRFLATAPSNQGFAAVWGVQDAAFDDSIHLRFFDASGRPRTPEIVAVPSAIQVSLQSAALDADGNLLLLWTPPTPGALRARLFSASTGAPLGPVYQLGRFDGYTCGDAAWTGDSWLIAYRSTGDGGRGAIVWRRLME